MSVPSIDQNTRYAVRAVCTIAGTSAEGETFLLWFGNDYEEAQLALDLISGERAHAYRDFEIVDRGG